MGVSQVDVLVVVTLLRKILRKLCIPDAKKIQEADDEANVKTSVDRKKDVIILRQRSREKKKQNDDNKTDKTTTSTAHLKFCFGEGRSSSGIFHF